MKNVDLWSWLIWSSGNENPLKLFYMENSISHPSTFFSIFLSMAEATWIFLIAMRFERRVVLIMFTFLEFPFVVLSVQCRSKWMTQILHSIFQDPDFIGKKNTLRLWSFEFYQFPKSVENKENILRLPLLRSIIWFIQLLRYLIMALCLNDFCKQTLALSILINAYDND